MEKPNSDKEIAGAIVTSLLGGLADTTDAIIENYEEQLRSADTNFVNFYDEVERCYARGGDIVLLLGRYEGLRDISERRSYTETL